MTRIKNFRINLRPREIVRWLKKERGYEVTPALEASVEHSQADMKRFLQPSALYTTIARATAEKTTPLPLPAKDVALSVVAVTLGPALEIERQAAASQADDTLREPLLSAFMQEALSQAMAFSMRLVQEQAKDEDCELSDPQPVQDSAQIAALSALLSTSRIGLEINPEAPALPPYARMAWVSWTPLRKERRAAPAASRMEKAAV